MKRVQRDSVTRIVAGAADLPLFVYNLPGSTGVEVTSALMQKIRERVPQLQGLKHSAPNTHNVRMFVAMGLSCFIGNGALMLPALTMGACGCVDGPPNIAPEPWVEIWNAYQDGDLERAQEAQLRAVQVWNAAVEFDNYFGAVKALVSERLGIDCGAPRPPASPLSAEQREQLSRKFAEIGLPEVKV